MSTLTKIISGGQTGADTAGLHAAFNMGFQTGGIAPKGWLVCNPDGTDGRNPDLAKFGLTEDSRSEYQNRTRKNAANSDGTLWVGYEQSAGGRLTQAACVKAGKPIIINPSPEDLRAWLAEKRIATLNVAGNRASDFNPEIYRASDFNPEIYERTYNLLVAALGYNGAAGKVHYLKTWPEFFGAVRDGLKKFEIRFNDRGFQVGDILSLLEYSPGSGYTGLSNWQEITYILSEGYGLSSGYVAMSLRPHVQLPVAGSQI